MILEIINKTNSLFYNQKYKKEIQILISKLQNKSFADVFEFEFRSIGRHFHYQFQKDGKFSKKYYFHIKYLSSFIEEIDE